MSKIAETRHRQGGGCRRQGLVFDTKCEYMTKIVQSAGGVKYVSSTGGVNDKGGVRRLKAENYPLA